jgi:hypothetical protein
VYGCLNEPSPACACVCVYVRTCVHRWMEEASPSTTYLDGKVAAVDRRAVRVQVQVAAQGLVREGHVHGVVAVVVNHDLFVRQNMRLRKPRRQGVKSGFYESR